MDAKLLPLVDLAEEGDSEALWELVSAYTYGRGVRKDKRYKKHYLKKLSEKPDHRYAEGYGSLLTLLGDVCFDLKEYEEAAEWYMKSIHYFLNHFPIETAQGLINLYETEIGLARSFYWDTDSKELVCQ